MDRRDFLSLPAAALAPPKKGAAPVPPMEQVRTLFLNITRGYLANASKTSRSMAVVEYPNATITQNFLAKSGKSVTGVTRMLPAMAAWAAGGHKDPDLLGPITDALRHGTDPSHADYWGAAPKGKQDQRQVESSIVAWSAWLLRDQLMPRLGEEGRRNLSEWLASCTQTPVRRNNWAWFTAVNIAAQIALSEKWHEFEALDPFMIEDLQALDAMAVGSSGWYNDDPKGASFDYYNAWVFASHFLYWNEITGNEYPEWRDKFATRLKSYLDTVPYFFAGHGGHVLYGRSLIYRWGVLTPLILAYRQKLWPHSIAMLRAIVERNILYFAGLGSFDETTGKLRETLTPEGSANVRETYIDGGHPYWGMQAFALWLIPPDDPFWNTDPEPLPVERSDYSIALPDAGLLVVGTRMSGHVRVYNARSTKEEPMYRDKYVKLCYSSHFPFAVTHDKTHATLDNVLALRNIKTGEIAVRGAVTESSVESDKFELTYSITLGGVTAQVKTEVQVVNEFESRIHQVEITGGPLDDIEVVEGGVPYSPTPIYPDVNLTLWRMRGWTANADEDAAGSSLLWARHKVQVLKAPAQEKMLLASMRYQSPKAMPKDKVDVEAQSLLKRLRV